MREARLGQEARLAEAGKLQRILPHLARDRGCQSESGPENITFWFLANNLLERWKKILPHLGHARGCCESGHPANISFGSC